ncbi:LysR substrate-binding domain-containing protein [Mycobacterium sp. MBM]|nr:LysR substrate-binding domain-containing protein [Mycobacterium sp. MBM]
MDLRIMRYVLAVVEERHFGRAAERVHIAQPALSQQIIQLEAQLGVRLFERSTRRVEVTEAGERFAEHARRILEAAARAADEMAAYAQGRVGRVSVGFVGTATYDVLPRLTRLVHAQLPEIDLPVRGELLSPQLLDGLRAGVYDLAFVRPSPEVAADLDLQTLRTEELLAVLPAGHRLAGADRVNLADLQEETFVTHPSGERSWMHHRVLEACARSGFRPATIEVSETATLVVSVAAGLGVALAPAPVRSLGLDGVTYRQLRSPETVELVLARRTDVISPAVQSVLALARQAGRVPG